MTDYLSLTTVMIGLRLLSLILAMAMMAWWTPSFWRVIRGREQGRDAARAIWVILAGSVFLFQVRWLAPGIDELTRMRIWVIAQAAMTCTQLAAIYHHGSSDPGFDMRRTVQVHVAMIVLCIVYAAMTR